MRVRSCLVITEIYYVQFIRRRKKAKGKIRKLRSALVERIEELVKQKDSDAIKWYKKFVERKGAANIQGAVKNPALKLWFDLTK